MAANPYPLEPLFGRILSPFEQFLRQTSAGGIVLIATTAVALASASVFGEPVLHRVLEQHLSLSAGSGASLVLSIHHWVNDGLMALFFLLVGLELKREILVGELASPGDAALPVVAAVGGMVVPALVFLAFNGGGPNAHGWGIPMATDIAFAVGICVLLGRRVPRNLIVFLTALAIVDDLGAVLMIAFFYTDRIDGLALGVGAALFAFLVLLNRGGVRQPLAYWTVGIAFWLALLASGVHATVAGVLLAFAIPARGGRTPAQFAGRITQLQAAFHAELGGNASDDPLRNHRMAALAEEVERTARTVQSPLQRMEHALAPWVTFFVIPIFALANAGIDLTAIDWGRAFASHLTLGVAAGLLAGKFVGIGLASVLAVRLGVGRLPEGVSWMQLLGAAWLAGIGFTMSLFVSQLAFADAAARDAAKLGILAASLFAAVIGLAWLWWSARPQVAP